MLVQVNFRGTTAALNFMPIHDLKKSVEAIKHFQIGRHIQILFDISKVDVVLLSKN